MTHFAVQVVPDYFVDAIEGEQVSFFNRTIIIIEQRYLPIPDERRSHLDSDLSIHLQHAGIYSKGKSLP